MIVVERKMATRQGTLGLNVAGAEAQAQVIGGLRFDWAVIAASAWLVGGAFLDGWAHNHGKVDNTFFTPWHAVLYSGYLAVAVVILGAMILNKLRGVSWGRALPGGYELSLIGVAVFALGGVGDLIWHNLFGFEVDIEALLSPTHLMLVTGVVLMVSGPIRAAWHRTTAETQARGLAAYLPIVLSALYVYSILTFITQFSHPFQNPFPFVQFKPASRDNFYPVGLGTVDILLHSALLMGVVLLVLRRWSLPFGSLTLLFTANGALMTTQHDWYSLIPVALLAGLAADVLLWRWKPITGNRNRFRTFAFAVPAIFYALYFGALALMGGVWWSIHMWAGVIVMAGAVGLFMSYLVMQPQIPAEA
jgi:hypothetical protein